MLQGHNLRPEVERGCRIDAVGEVAAKVWVAIVKRLQRVGRVAVEFRGIKGKGA
jgi:hypothetical protein